VNEFLNFKLLISYFYIMQKNKKLIIGIGIALLFILLLANFSFFTSTQHISIYKVENSDSDILINAIQNLNITKGTMTVKSGQSNDSTFVKTEDLKINYRYTHEESIGLGRFLPLYKPVSFNGKAAYQWDVVQNNGKKISNSGKFEFDGGLSIKGFCSASTASKSIRKAIKKAIEDQIKKEVNEQLSDNSRSTIVPATKSTSYSIQVN
jgi:hypothetical protein